MKKIKIAVLGYGYWGPNLVRNFSCLDNCQVKYVVDLDANRLKTISSQYPSIKLTTRSNDVFKDPEIDGVVIALPVSLHFKMAQKALKSDKNVLIEKPLTGSRTEALKLIDLAQEKNKTLMVDHTFLYTGAIQKIKQIIDSKQIGDIQYFDSVRINLGLFRHDTNVVWDLAPHDLSILTYLVKEKPYAISCQGISHLKNGIENIAYLTVKYKSNKIAHINVSWTSPVKIRKIIVGGSQKMVIFDDLEPTEKVKIYDYGYMLNDKDKSRVYIDYRMGDILTPKIEISEALKNMAADFVAAISQGKKPISDWQNGFEVVSLLEAANKSIKKGGKEIKIL